MEQDHLGHGFSRSKRSPMSYTRRSRAHKFALAAAFAALSASAQAPEVKRTILQRHDTTVPGYEALLVQVDISVSGREGRHTHPGLAMVRVEQGTLTLDYEGKPTAD